ncbi:hypothetical protein COLO4_36222 [Corchorus olitorius]|uniref:Uncharacterized protein n=1 Tax=Corchorus olitorius TaxID=93759 RepID=A0A1R3GAF4_9ROSI|nr:hypothetical protein COLO4_36222 [Corchorus olitorius]
MAIVTTLKKKVSSNKDQRWRFLWADCSSRNLGQSDQ